MIIDGIYRPLPPSPKKFSEATNGTLYHYTSIPALKSILEKGEFWLSNLSNTNDKTELVFAIDLFKQNIEPHIFEERKDNLNNFFSMLKNKMYPLPFFMSFTTLPDDAAQWERYADNARGVNIKFSSENLYKSFTKERVAIEKVDYILKVTTEPFDSSIINYINDKGNVYLHGEFAIIDYIKKRLRTYKHKSFKSEKEYKIVFDYNSPLGKIDYTCNNNCIKEVFRIDMKGLCAERNMSFEDLFDGIIIGPRSNQLSEHLHNYLISIGYEKLADKISYSDCPLR